MTRALKQLAADQTGGTTNLDWIYTDIIDDSPGAVTTDKYKLLRFASGDMLFPEHFMRVSKSRISSIDLKITGLIRPMDKAILVFHFYRCPYTML